MSFTDIFGGNTIYSANVSYRAVALNANVTLDWPTETAPTGNVLSSILDVTPSGAGFTIRLPAANKSSVGETALFFNVGANTFTVADNGGNTVASVAAGQAWQVYMTGNATANGTWRSYQYGAGTSYASAASLIGAGIKAIGTTLNQAMSTTTLNANYAVGNADRSEVFNWTGGAGEITLPSAADVGADWFIHVRNSGTGGLTIQPSAGGQTINGASSVVFNPSDSAIVFCDGVNYFTIGFGRNLSFAFDFVSISLTGQPSPFFLTGANLNRITYRFTGTITEDVQIVVPSTVQQYWVSNETDLASQPYVINIKTLTGAGVNVARNERAILYSDGTNIIDADTAAISFPLTVPQGGTGGSTQSAARIGLGATAIGSSIFTAATESYARSILGATVVGDSIFTLPSPSAIRFIRINTDNTATAVAATGTGSVVLSTSPVLTTPSASTLTVTSQTVSTLTAQLSNVDDEFQLNVLNGATGTTAGTVKATLGLYYLGSTLNGGIQFVRGSDGTNGWLNFITAGVERVRIDSAGNVGIGTSTPNAAAKLDVSSTVSGFLPPRMTTAERDAISSPPNGLMLYNSTTDKLQVRAAGSWVDLH